MSRCQYFISKCPKILGVILIDSIFREQIMEDKLEQQVKQLYQQAKEESDNESLQMAVDVIKTMRRSRGSLQAWNQRYREGIDSLSEEVKIREAQNLTLQEELKILSQEMEIIAYEKQRLQAEKQKVMAELREIEIQVNVAAKKVQSTHSLYGKFSIVWEFLQSVFFSDDPQDFGAINNAIEPDPDKPQMGSGVANNQRSLLDK